MSELRTTIQKILRDPKDARRALRQRSVALVSRLGGAHDLRWRVTSRADVFARVYESQMWGSNESGSGTGSEARATASIVQELPALLRRLGVESLLDAPCGDWNWMKDVDLPVGKYYGVDIVPKVVDDLRSSFGDDRHEFRVADLTVDTLPGVDAILCRDCLVHVSNQDIALILGNFRRTGATWLLLNTYPEITANRNQFTGHNWRRLNFELPPFSFPEPLESVPDGGEVDPSRLALWRLEDLPRIRA